MVKRANAQEKNVNLNAKEVADTAEDHTDIKA